MPSVGDDLAVLWQVPDSLVGPDILIKHLPRVPRAGFEELFERTEFPVSVRAARKAFSTLNFFSFFNVLCMYLAATAII